MPYMMNAPYMMHAPHHPYGYALAGCSVYDAVCIMQWEMPRDVSSVKCRVTITALGLCHADAHVGCMCTTRQRHKRGATNMGATSQRHHTRPVPLVNCNKPPVLSLHCTFRVHPVFKRKGGRREEGGGRREEGIGTLLPVCSGGGNKD